MELNLNKSRLRNLSEYNALNYSDVINKKHCLNERNDINGLKYMIQESNVVPLGMNHRNSPLKSEKLLVKKQRHPSTVKIFNSDVNQPIFYLSNIKLEEPSHNVATEDIQRILTQRRNREALKLNKPLMHSPRSQSSSEHISISRDSTKEQISEILDQYIRN